AQGLSRSTVKVGTAATSDPTRELITPVARNSWNVSAGIRNWSSRNGTAAVRLPKKLTRPASAGWGESEGAPAASANHPAKSTKLRERSFPVCGKLNEAGT